MTELETLVVRLTGDGSSYASMMKSAEETTKRTTSIIVESIARISGFHTALRNLAGQVLSSFALLGVSGSLTGMFDRFVKAEQQMLRLKAAIETSGKASDPVIEQYQKFSDAIVKETLLTKGQVLGM